MLGGYRYSFRKRTKKYRGRGLSKSHNKRKKSRKINRKVHKSKYRKTRSKNRGKHSMRGGSLSQLHPAEIDSVNKIIASNQPHVGPNFNTSAGYGFKFTDPALGGSFEANTQCTNL